MKLNYLVILGVASLLTFGCASDCESAFCGYCEAFNNPSKYC